MDYEIQEGTPLADGNGKAGRSSILPLVESGGNREVLIDWIDERESYELVTLPDDIGAADFDCLICDTENLWTHRETLLARSETEEPVLPYVLLADESEENRVRERFRRDHPALWETVNAIIGMPIATYRLDDRIQTLLQMRAQSRDLLEQRKQLQAIRDEHAGHGVVITDREGTIEYVNRAFELQSGYDKNEAIGEQPSILKSGEQSEAFYQDLWETILSGEVWQGEVINERKDGEQYVLDQTIAPVEDSDGEIERFIAVNHETTQLKEMETSLRHQREQLEILNRVLRHDIRNDLHVILGWAEALESYTDAEGTKYLQRIKRSGEHIVELTKVAKEISEAIFDDEAPDLQPIELTKSIEDEVQKRNATFENASIELGEMPAEPKTVWANEMMSSVFRNLINNAVQHNDSDSPEVVVSVTDENGMVQVQIADNGPGIPDERKQHIFDKEHKGLDSAGTGMGLFLVQSLIEIYEGEISVEDNTPRGTVFTVSLQTADSTDQMGGRS